MGWTASRAWHVAREGLGAQAPGGGRQEDGDLLPLVDQERRGLQRPCSVRPSVRLSVGGFGSLAWGKVRAPLRGTLTLCCLSSRGSPQVTRISTSTARPMQGWPGRWPQDGEDGPQTGTRLYCESALCRPTEALGPGRGSCCR